MGNGGSTINTDNTGIYLPSVYQEGVESFKQSNLKQELAFRKQTEKMNEQDKKIDLMIQNQNEQDRNIALMIRNQNELDKKLDLVVQYFRIPYTNLQVANSTEQIPDPNQRFSTPPSGKILKESSIETFSSPQGKAAKESNTETFSSSSTKKRFLWLYSEPKLLSALKELDSKLSSSSNTLKDLALLSGSESSTELQAFDKIFFFYFLTIGRDEAATIIPYLTKIQERFGSIDLNLVILRDNVSRSTPVDFSKFNNIKLTPNYFTIYTDPTSYSDLIFEKDFKIIENGMKEEMKLNLSKLKEYLKGK